MRQQVVNPAIGPAVDIAYDAGQVDTGGIGGGHDRQDIGRSLGTVRGPRKRECPEGRRRKTMRQGEQS